jgi:trans-2,3-dihydro-3-hydroxyanthranilate isomerase
MRSYRYLHLDVFTDRLVGGNQLAVVLDARGLTPQFMQAIAKEMNFSETTFVLPPERSDADMRVRIFTPGEELPMAGHPTVGTAFALARAGVIGPDRASVVFGLGVGPTEVALTWKRNDLSFAWMAQRPPTFENEIHDRAGIAECLEISARAIADVGPVQTVSCGVPFLLVPVVSRREVDAARFNAARYDAFKRTHGGGAQVCVYVFSVEAGTDGATAYSRMFAPSIGIGEDAATGSAAGPLACYLIRHRIVPIAQASAMRTRQGVKMGRPSDIHQAVEVTGDAIVRVRIGGEAVLAGEGTLYL